ncbi:MAG: hypothetical protein K8R40_10930 [Anaerolineaceae bacterium]|nr:hypothetical protein [Anaerolineaceae bacterium]
MVSNQQNSIFNRPDKVTAIAVLSLLNGIVSVFWGIIISIGALATIVGICCLPATILPIILGGFEIVYAVHLLSNPPRPSTPSKTIAILDIISIIYGNFISLVIGILLLVFYNDSDVKKWFNTMCKENSIEELPVLELSNSENISDIE